MTVASGIDKLACKQKINFLAGNLTVSNMCMGSHEKGRIYAMDKLAIYDRWIRLPEMDKSFWDKCLKIMEA